MDERMDILNWFLLFILSYGLFTSFPNTVSGKFPEGKDYVFRLAVGGTVSPPKDFHPPEPRNKFLLFEATQFMVLCYVILRKLT